MLSSTVPALPSARATPLPAPLTTVHPAITVLLVTTELAEPSSVMSDPFGTMRLVVTAAPADAAGEGVPDAGDHARRVALSTRFTGHAGYAGIVTPEKLADLARLRRARDLMDREYARPLVQ
jgi:hypothetical protein